jgi:hypothetical protein
MSKKGFPKWSAMCIIGNGFIFNNIVLEKLGKLPEIAC